MSLFKYNHFEKFSKLIYNNLGIVINDTKVDMLKNKLTKLMNKNGIKSYDEFYEFLLQKGHEELLINFFDEMTINKTDFFRENYHFEFIKQKKNFILEKNHRIIRNRELRAWSSACSTGEEAYSLAITLKEAFGDQLIIKILATDVSHRVVSSAINGIYPLSIHEEIDRYYLGKYFIRNANHYQVSDAIRELITFRVFNLTHPFPFSNTFDLILCRNVMIYFDAKFQQTLLQKFYQQLTPGGLFLVGHSESFINRQHHFKYIQPTIYLK